MSRSEKKQNSNPVSLFPFLAVLLCTMGALVVLLVAMAEVSRQGAVAAAEVAEAAAQAELQAKALEAEALATEQAKELVDPEVQRRLEKAKDYLEQLASVENEADESLRVERLRLSQAEDHIRRLREELTTLMSAAVELEALEEEHYDDRAQAERELERLSELIADSEAEIEQLRKEVSDEEPSYSIVPYKGLNGTRRRPVYLECLEDRVILQPEGVVLSEQDFAPPLGVGNPLAAALRAAREYVARENPETAGDIDSEPYPLILVRPEGIPLYYRVREAIRSWDSDFGYELIDSDWDLDFPLPNPALATVEVQAIEASRQRRRTLAQAAPRAYGTPSFSSGARPNQGAGGYGSGSQPYDSEALGPGGRSNQKIMNTGNGTSAADATEYLRNGGREQNDQATGGGGGLASSSRSESRSEAEQGGSTGRDAYSDSTESLATSSLSQSTFAQSASHSGAQSSDDWSANEGQSQNAGGSAASGSTSPAGQAGAQSGASGSASGSNGESSSAAGGAPTQVASASSASPDLDLSSKKPTGIASLLEQKSENEIAMQRAIQVVVQRDRLLFVTDPNAATASDPSAVANATLPMEGSTREHLPEFVQVVKARMKSWGLAGQGLYWKPVLVLNVGLDGDQRATEIARLLQDAGIDIRLNRVAQRPSSDRGGANVTR